MAATVAIQRITSTGPAVYTTVTAVRLRTDDANTSDNTNPVPIPSAGFKYSYWASICLDLSGSFTQITNVRHYSDGAIGWNFGTAGELRRGNRDTGDDGCPNASYIQASGTPGDTGDELGATHTYYSGQTTKTTSVASDVVGAPCTVDSGTYTGASKTKHMVLQVKVDTNATQGVQSSETLTWKWDEI